MPGIFGIITSAPAQQAAAELATMASAMSAERFFVSGTRQDRERGVYVGWTAREGSFSAAMPLRNERGDIVLVFSGEDYPDPCSLQRLRQQGHEFESDGPSYLVHCYEDDRLFPAGLNGKFHGIVTDSGRGQTVLFNDRFGMHRLYYHESPDRFYFASEAKAILAVCPDLRRLNWQGVGEFVSCGAALEDRSLFEGIRVLPSGSAWTFRNGELEQKKTYFRPEEWEQLEELEPEAHYQELRRTFAHNLPRYFAGSERVAMSLTGGLDTRMILANYSADPDSMPCYTFGSMFRDNHDVRVARRVAAISQQKHETIIAGQEFLSRFPDYARRTVYFSEGLVDVGRAPDLYLNERARAIAPVRMTGNYGGEILRGIVAFKPQETHAGLFSPELMSWVQRAEGTYAAIAGGHPISFAVFRQGPWYLHGVLTLEDTQVAMRSPYLDNEFVRTVFRSPARALRTNEISVRLVADGSPTLLEIPTDRGVTGKPARMHQAAHRAFLELQFKAEYAYDMGMPEWLARTDHFLAPLKLHRIFLGRHKPFHFRVWYRDALAGYLQEMLLDERSLSRPYIERKGLQAVVRGHLKGDRNYTTELHKVLTLELLHRLFLDSPSPN
jgi:asparagine synthase (glutamine-hydrolysing)